MGSSIRAVVFDFGGVLISPITTLIAEVAAWHEVTMVEMLEVLMGPRRDVDLRPSVAPRRARRAGDRRDADRGRAVRRRGRADAPR